MPVFLVKQLYLAQTVIMYGIRALICSCWVLSCIDPICDKIELPSGSNEIRKVKITAFAEKRPGGDNL
jgi:hypothetical protein